MSTNYETFRKLPRSKRKSRKQRLAMLVPVSLILASLCLLCLWDGSPVRLFRSSAALPDDLFLARSSSEVLLDVPFLDQRQDFPTGCESVTAVMALNYYGKEMDPETFISNYLPLGNAPYRNEAGELVGCDPRKAFPGDPRSQTGWGCYAKVIQKALLEAAGPGFRVEELSGKSLSSLCRDYLDWGVPVLLWVTIDMDPPVEGATWQIEGSNETFTWIEPLHCALLVGYDRDHYYFNDPLQGKAVCYGKDQVETAYHGMGEQAVVLMKSDDPAA